ncbi:hypothetical protein AQUCO_01700138v1 [Aquilegia coerulea]|uniref:Pectinesterase inhibitor domain-containing protein n=1 Tax=Aquilegia coerulea TaxID=218851 RepID=A0A2G5DLE4_AQUCA|nr:hypothetical protein AQUCO_01700138v1 [Aquilegia coerulea]
MGYVSRFIFVLPLILSISIRPHQVIAKNATAPGDLISKTCQNAVNEELCVQTLRADPNSKQADASGLAKIAIKLALANATAISDQVKKLLATTTGHYEKTRLTDCNENYATAIDQLEDSLAAINSNGINDATTWVQAAMTDSETCEDGFEEEPGHKSMLSDKSTLFQQLCGNALAILNTLPH